MMEKHKFEIIKEDLYKQIKPNQTTAKNGIIFFNADVDDNAYPQSLVDRYLNASSTHANLINIKRNLTFGSGFVPVNEEDEELINFLNKKNIHGDDNNDVLIKCALDFAIQEMAAFQILFSADSKIAQIIHIDQSKLRSPFITQLFNLCNYT